MGSTQHLFEAVTRLGQALAARQPLVLCIDDWHWADAASLDVLHYAAVRWAEGPHSGGGPTLGVAPRMVGRQFWFY